MWTTRRRDGGPWAASCNGIAFSPRVATTDNSTLSAGARDTRSGRSLSLTLRAHPWTVRLDGFNLTDARGLHVSSLDVVLPEQGRRFILTVATDLIGGRRSPGARESPEKSLVSLSNGFLRSQNGDDSSCSGSAGADAA